MAEKTVKVAVIGFGTVGSGVAELLLEDVDYIEARTGIKFELARIVDIDTERERHIVLSDGLLTDDLNSVLEDNSIDIAVELVGGTTVARDIQLKLLAAGKNVVTANKALLAEHGNELYAAAHKADKCIAFEASCAGGIPIISAIRTGLAANKIKAIYGIVNGTCNYILSNMTEKNMPFSDALEQAQEKGYAEADPTLDINGSDSAHKLAILASIAFGCEITLKDILIEGIESIDISDIRYGREMGYTLKLLAIGEKLDDGRIFLRVRPCFISSDSTLARVGGPFNAVSIFGHAVGQTMFYGRGAGMMPTASAVVADIIEVAMGNSIKLFKHVKLETRDEANDPIGNIDDLVSRFYIRLKVLDKPGGFAKICTILADKDISISGVLQHEEHNENNVVPAVVITHPTEQKKINSAIEDLGRLDIVRDKPVCLSIVDIPEDSDE
ncbi:MAG: homoserine dehydrogenase [Sedimentisphaerales bacterium]|nr:homoserine dehydrogenase [Sedimentisphaerales bacterium]